MPLTTTAASVMHAIGRMRSGGGGSIVLVTICITADNGCGCGFCVPRKKGGTKHSVDGFQHYPPFVVHGEPYHGYSKHYP